MAAGEFMVELKYPQQAKDKLQKEVDNSEVAYVRQFWLFSDFSSLVVTTETILWAVNLFANAMSIP